MTGSLRHAARRDAAADDPYRRAVVRLDDGSDVAYRDVRRFGTWLLLEPDEVEPYLDARVGPEPLDAAFAPRSSAQRLANRRAPVKAALLDQRTLAGVGNIYADEALWRARIHPLREARSLERREVTRAPRKASGERSSSGSRGRARRCATTRSRTAAPAGCRHEFKVYGRAGEPCDRCGTPIEKIRVAGRGTWYCPALPAAAAQRLQPADPRRLAPVAGRTYKTEAIVLRSLRFSEADRILHLYTRDRGRIGAIAKGVRKTKSRFGARLEPLSHVELVLHEGSGELQTVTGVALIALAPRDARERLPARASA